MATEPLYGGPRRLGSRNALLEGDVNRALGVPPDVLKAHYLAEIVCDHSLRVDQPRCACSLVDLGWHGSVGAAVDAWIAHVLDVTLAPKAAGPRARSAINESPSVRDVTGEGER